MRKVCLLCNESPGTDCTVETTKFRQKASKAALSQGSARSTHCLPGTVMQIVQASRKRTRRSPWPSGGGCAAAAASRSRAPSRPLLTDPVASTFLACRWKRRAGYPKSPLGFPAQGRWEGESSHQESGGQKSLQETLSSETRFCCQAFQEAPGQQLSLGGKTLCRQTLRQAEPCQHWGQGAAVFLPPKQGRKGGLAWHPACPPTLPHHACRGRGKLNSCTGWAWQWARSREPGGGAQAKPQEGHWDSITAKSWSLDSAFPGGGPVWTGALLHHAGLATSCALARTHARTGDRFLSAQPRHIPEEEAASLPTARSGSRAHGGSLLL